MASLGDSVVGSPSGVKLGRLFVLLSTVPSEDGKPEQSGTEQSHAGRLRRANWCVIHLKAQFRRCRAADSIV